MAKQFDAQAARQAGYSDQEINSFLSKSQPNFDAQAAQEAGYSPEEINNFLSKSQSKAPTQAQPRKNLIESGARALGQFGIGAAEAGTLGLSLPAIAGKAFVQVPGVAETLYRERLFEDIEEMGQKKRSGQWNDEDEKYLQNALELVRDPDKMKKFIPEDIQSFDTGSLLEKAFESVGIDMKPENMAEQAVRWVGFIKDPRKLFELSKLGIDLIKGPEKWKHYIKALMPTVKEASRGIGAAAALEVAADNNLGPLGTMTAAIIGDIAGGGIPGAVKGAVEFAKHPIQSTKAGLAKGVASGTKLITKPQELKIKQDLIEQFRAAGIQADLGSITGSNLIKTMQARLTQSGLVGDALDAFRKDLTNQIVGEYGKLANELGEARFSTIHDAGVALKEGVEKARDVDLSGIRQLYKETREFGKGKNVTFEIPELAKKIEALESELAPGAIKSPETQKVMREIESLKSELFDSNGNLKPVPVSNLLNNKINLGDIIDYDVQGGAKQLLKGIVKDIDNALLKYGSQDREFLKKYVTSNKRFAKHAKTYRNDQISKLLKNQDPSTLMNQMNSVEGVRNIKNALGESIQGKNLFNDLKRAKFEDVVMKNMVDGATEQLKMGKFSNILEKGKNREVIRELLGEGNFHRLERLQNATGKLAESAQKYFNASKSGTTAIDAALVTKALFDMASMMSGNPWPFMKTAGTFYGARRLAKLITDPVFLKTVEDGLLAGERGNTKALKEYFNYLGNSFLHEDMPSPKSNIPMTAVSPSEKAFYSRNRQMRNLSEKVKAKQELPSLEGQGSTDFKNKIFEDNPEFLPNISEKTQKHLQEINAPALSKILHHVRKMDTGKHKELSSKTIEKFKPEWNKYFPEYLFDKFYNPARWHEEELGYLGDFIQGERARKFLNPVLDTPIRKKPSDIQAVGFYHPLENYIAVDTTSSPAEVLSTLFHEGWHAVQNFTGKLEKYPFPGEGFINYIKDPKESRARLMERWATKDIQNYRKTLIKTKSKGFQELKRKD